MEIRRRSAHALLSLLVTVSAVSAQVTTASAVRSISVRLNAPANQALAAFGPTQESKWSPTWAPRFLSMTGSTDDPDEAVFETGAENAPTTWVLSRYDRATHRIQYVSVQPNVLATVIDIECVPDGAQQTVATITYRRTALRAESNRVVEDFAQHFASTADHWQQTLNHYLQTKKP